MMRRPSLCATALATALLLSLAACGDDGDDTDSSSTSQSDDSTDTGGETEAEPAIEEPAGGDAPAGGITFVDAAETDAAAVITIGPDGFDPAEISVAVGDVVQFTAGDNDGVYGVVVNDLDGYTVTSGIDEYFSVDAAGTYAVTEEISGATATITAG